MAVRSRQIGWSPMSNALYEVLREINALKGQFATPVPPTTTTTTTTFSTNRFSFRVYTNQISSNNLTIETANSYNDSIIYWGDGTSEILYIASVVYPTHTYPSLGYYNIEIEFVSLPILYNIFLDSIIASNIKNIDNLTNIQTYLSFVNCSLTSNDVNSVLNEAILANWSSGDKTIDLSGNTPPAPPTGQGVTDKTVLISNGCSIITD